MATRLTCASRGRPRPRRLAFAVVAALTAIATLAAGCGSSASVAPSPTPQVSLSAAIAQTRGQIADALGARRIELRTPQASYLPAEAEAVRAAPRAIVQAVLPDDPAHGYIVVYDFADAAAASAAAHEQAAYVASGPGRVQFPLDAQFVLRQLGTTLIFYAWSPGSSTDPRAPDVAAALETLGLAVPVGS